MSKTVYDDSSISQLKGAERVRMRPEALLGSRGIDGAIHTIQEIIGNATDEKLAGYGDKIDIAYHEDGSITVRDYGRGVPLGWNEKEKNWNYILIYSELYAGGKYSDNQAVLKQINDSNGWGNFNMSDYPYLISIGLNGLGSACSQYTSEFFEVRSYRDGVMSRMEFRKGEPYLDELDVRETSEPNGTYIHWKPDAEVFTDIDIPVKWFESTCKALAFVSGFEVNLNIKGNLKHYAKSSIEEVLKNEVGYAVASHAFKHIVDNTGDICICDLTTVVGPGGKRADYYHNMVSVRGGAHSQGCFVAMSRFFKEVGSKEGIKVDERDYSGKLSIVVSTLANKSSLRNQTKDSIDDFWICEFISDTILESLRKEYTKGTPWLTEVVEDVILNAQNRIAVAEMSKNLKEIQKATNKHKASGKFVTCRSYEEGRAAETELLIVEGDSAGGSTVLARASDYQCMLKIRGKSLNVLKAPLQRLIANQEILDLISVLGCGIDLGIDGFESFDISKLKVGKIIFCSDADVDGLHIRMLLFNVIYRLFGNLLSTGHIYVAEPPLYVINLKNGESLYCMTQEELAEKQKELGSHNISTIDRFKGLGECEPEVLWDTTLNPETRRLRQIIIDPKDTDIYEALEVLFGKSTDIRKRAILGSMLGTDFDDTIESIDDMVDYIDNLDLNGGLSVEEYEYH